MGQGSLVPVQGMLAGSQAFRTRLQRSPKRDQPKRLLAIWELIFSPSLSYVAIPSYTNTITCPKRLSLLHLLIKFPMLHAQALNCVHQSIYPNTWALRGRFSRRALRRLVFQFSGLRFFSANAPGLDALLKLIFFNPNPYNLNP